jgi:hypothetical protein
MSEHVNKKQLKDPGTWRGIAMLLAIFGINISPESILEISTGLGALIGLINTFKKPAK